jgi:hypothetical protein
MRAALKTKSRAVKRLPGRFSVASAFSGSCDQSDWGVGGIGLGPRATDTSLSVAGRQRPSRNVASLA